MLKKLKLYVNIDESMFLNFQLFLTNKNLDLMECESE
jgi:hypothetical protein